MIRVECKFKALTEAFYIVLDTCYILEYNSTFLMIRNIRKLSHDVNVMFK